MLSYHVWTEEECKTRNTVPDGDYAFEITNAIVSRTKGKIDQDGRVVQPIRDMLVIDFNFFTIHGVQRKLTDWIVFMENMDWKLRYLAAATNLLYLYEEKKLQTHNLIGKKGTFTLAVKDMQAKDGTLTKVNYVKNYVTQVPDDLARSNSPTPHGDVPF